MSTTLQTVAAIVLVPALALATYAGFVSLQLFETLLSVVLGAYGIQAVLAAKKATALDLFTFITDKALVAIDSLASITALFALNVMPQSNYLAFLILILGAFGIGFSVAKAK